MRVSRETSSFQHFSLAGRRCLSRSCPPHWTITCLTPRQTPQSLTPPPDTAKLVVPFRRPLKRVRCPLAVRVYRRRQVLGKEVPLGLKAVGWGEGGEDVNGPVECAQSDEPANRAEATVGDDDDSREGVGVSGRPAVQFARVGRRGDGGWGRQWVEKVSGGRRGYLGSGAHPPSQPSRRQGYPQSGTTDEPQW